MQRLPTARAALAALLIAALPILSGCAITIPIGGDSQESPDVELALPQKEFWQPGYRFRHRISEWSVPAFEAMNVVDIGQTVQIARSPDCYSEIDPVTSRVIGSHPGGGAAAAWLAAEGVAFYYAAAYLDSKDTGDSDGQYSIVWRGIRYLFTGAILLSKAQTVYNNNRIGLRPFGSSITSCRADSAAAAGAMASH